MKTKIILSFKDPPLSLPRLWRLGQGYPVAPSGSDIAYTAINDRRWNWVLSEIVFLFKVKFLSTGNRCIFVWYSFEHLAPLLVVTGYYLDYTESITDTFGQYKKRKRFLSRRVCPCRLPARRVANKLVFTLTSNDQRRPFSATTRRQITTRPRVGWRRDTVWPVHAGISFGCLPLFP